jgi:hypothetical protein
MPTAKFTIADVLDQGFAHPAIAQAVAVSPTAELDDAAMLAAFKKASSQVVAAGALAGLAGKLSIFKNPLEAATAFIEAKYNALGGASGFLGQATTPVTICPDKQGYFRHFKGGSIYWHYRTGAHEVHGAIRAKWSSLGWERSFLGYPTTDETTGRDPESKGRFNHFQGGSIYWHPSTGAFEVHGAIRVKYLELGAESSFLGYPTTDETSTPDRLGRFNHFQAGSIYWTPYVGAHEVHGLIRQLWAERGWERNPALGYPISDELIPDRRMGHSRPVITRKPIPGVPPDVIRFPEEVATPGMAAELPRTVAVAAPVAGAAALAVTPAVAATPVLATPALAVAATPATPVAAGGMVAGVRPEIAVGIRPELVGVIGTLFPTGVSQGAKEGAPSRNRFSDFENGVLFWQRGTGSAIQLQPWAQTAKGEKLRLTAAEVVAIASTPIRNALLRINGAQVAGLNFVGTTNYLFDGSGVHNRRHKIQTTLQGVRLGGLFPVIVTATVELHLEVAFDPLSRRITGQLTDWILLSATGSFQGGSVQRLLHSVLDPQLWIAFPMLTVPTQDGVPLPVLSVKTMPDGDVDVYIEP